MDIDIEDFSNKNGINNILFKKYSLSELKPFLLELSSKNYKSNREINGEVIQLKRKYSMNPKKAELRFVYDILRRQKVMKDNKMVEKFFKSKECRSLSGVMVISLITSPYPIYKDKNGEKKKAKFSCKYDCHFCPKEVDENNIMINPRSYLSDEPTVARGLQNNFDAKDQFNDRGFQYLINGHPVDKIELIILGGTWTSYPREYQEEFIRDAFYAANTFTSMEKRERLSLEEEQNINDKSKTARIIGVTLEMRPDSINEEEIRWLRYLGCTRVQLGIQHIDDRILRKVNRKCTTEQAICALELLLNACFKVDSHIMPDLPGSSPVIDKEMFHTIINSKNLQFDQWKIYPTTITPWTQIKKWFDEGKYTPYTEENPELLMEVLEEIKPKVPPWIRINRLVRDIPNSAKDGTIYICGGNKVTNLRQLINDRLEKKGKFCRCIRCCEVKKNTSHFENAKIVKREYESSGGKEVFISMEAGPDKWSRYKDGNWYNKKGDKVRPILFGFVRLRKPKKYTLSYLKNSYFVRELHVYGQVTIDRQGDNIQHKGVGKSLMNEVLKIAIVDGVYSIIVIAGIGVKQYYRKLGYVDYNSYMRKSVGRNEVLKIKGLWLVEKVKKSAKINLSYYIVLLTLLIWFIYKR